MLYERIGFRFSPAEKNVIEPPTLPSIEAVALLISHEVSTRSPPERSRRRTLVWFFDTMITEVFGSHKMGWWTRSSSDEPPSEKEVTVMVDEKEIKRREDELEQRLKTVLSNPELAAEALPNAEMRENIIPLLAHMRKLAEDSQKSEP